MNASQEMPPENLRRVEAVFNEALALPEGDRAKLIEARCGGDTALMAEVSSLLRACAEEEKAAAERLQALPEDGRCVEERKRVGAYEIDRLIGRGGMGAVYVAHRADGNFEQQVAAALAILDQPRVAPAQQALLQTGGIGAQAHR